MARLAMCGWETGSANQLGTAVVPGGGATNNTVTVVSATPSPRTGTYCLKVGHGSSTDAPLTTALAVAFGTSLTEHYGRVGIYGNTVTDVSRERVLLDFLDSASGAQLRLTLAMADNTLKAYRGASTALLATSSGAMSQGVWHLLEWRILVHDSTGVFQVKLDGVQIINYSGDTLQTANANVATLRLAGHTAVGSMAASFNAFDDLAINSTSGSVNTGWPGDGAIRALLPNGAGTTIGGTPLTPTGSGTNWQNVDELPPSTTDYNAGSAVGTGETYALGDPSGSIESCSAVNLVVYALNNDAGGGSIGLTVRSGSTNSEGSSQAITTTAAFYQRLMETDPTDSAAWTQSKLAALEAGITVR